MPHYHCVAVGCTSDVRKKGKYGYMMSVRFFAFPPRRNVLLRKRWLERLQRPDFDPSRFDRICSLHFVDGEPTNEHPYPEIFSYNSHQQMGGKGRNNSILKRSKCAENMNQNYQSTEMIPDASRNSDLVDQHRSSSPLPLQLEVTEESTECPSYYNEVQSDHEYVKTDSVFCEPDSRSVETQTELLMSDLDKMQEKLIYLEKKLKDNKGGNNGEFS